MLYLLKNFAFMASKNSPQKLLWVTHGVTPFGPEWPFRDSRPEECF
jgi:hypothetical protein